MESRDEHTRDTCGQNGDEIKSGAEPSNNGEIQNDVSREILKCHTCGLVFKWNYALKNHIATHTNERQFKCEICGKGFNREDTLRRHYITHTGELTHQCNDCGQGFSELGYLNKHTKQYRGACIRGHNVPHKCDTCGKMFRNAVFLEQHVNAQHNPERLGGTDGLRREQPSRIHTDSGENVVRFVNNISVHAGDNGTHEKTSFKCDICGKGFNLLNSLRSHARIHTGDLPCTCSICAHGVGQKTYLTIRLKKCDPEVQQQLAELSTKGAHIDAMDGVATTPSSVGQAILKHEVVSDEEDNEGEYPTDTTCTKSTEFSVACYLDKMSTAIADISTYSCGICSVTFEASAEYKAHIRTHGKERGTTHNVESMLPYISELNQIQDTISDQSEDGDDDKSLPSQLPDLDESPSDTTNMSTRPDKSHRDDSLAQMSVSNRSMRTDSDNVPTRTDQSKEDHVTSQIVGFTRRRTKIPCSVLPEPGQSDVGDVEGALTTPSRRTRNRNKIQSSMSTRASRPKVKNPSPRSSDWKCNICGKVYYRKHTRDRHLIIHTDRERPFKCETCGKSFFDMHDLKLHEKIHVQSREKYTCHLCGNAYIKKRSLLWHIRAHTGESFKCDHCDDNFKTYRRLTTHIRQNHTSKVYVSHTTCNICGNKVRTGSLECHLQIHAGTNRRKCHVCGKTLSDDRNLRDHMVMHTGEYKFKCDICGRGFTASRILQKHTQAVHTTVGEGDPGLPVASSNHRGQSKEALQFPEFSQSFSETSDAVPRRHDQSNKEPRFPPISELNQMQDTTSEQSEDDDENEGLPSQLSDLDESLSKSTNISRLSYQYNHDDSLPEMPVSKRNMTTDSDNLSTRSDQSIDDVSPQIAAFTQNKSETPCSRLPEPGQSNVGDVSDVRSVWDVGNVSDVRNNVADVGNMSNIGNVSDVGNMSDVRTLSDAGNVSDVRTVSDAGNVSDVRNNASGNMSDVDNMITRRTTTVFKRQDDLDGSLSTYQTTVGSPAPQITVPQINKTSNSSYACPDQSEDGTLPKFSRCNKNRNEIQSSMSTRVSLSTVKNPSSRSPNWKCDVCGQVCSSRYTRDRHLINIHTARERSFKCETCGKCFFVKHDRTLHEKIHVQSREKYTCHLCDVTYFYKHNLLRHNLTHTGELFKCDSCGDNFRTYHCLRAHAREHHTRNAHDTTCNICGKEVSAGTLRYHLQSHAGTNRRKCHVCGNTFCSDRGLKYHMATHTGEYQSKCDVCGKGCVSKGHLRTHMLTRHTKVKPHTCDICGKGFIWKSFLTKHRLIAHVEKKDRVRYTCDTCGKRYLSLKCLKNHTRMHTTGFVHTCEVCGKSFYTPGQLKNHLVYHNEKTCVCTVCDKTFHSAQQLRDHNKSVHTDVRPWVCDVCGKTFKTKSSLRSHMRLHSKEGKSYTCDICGKQFNTKPSLVYHISLHSTNRRYKCKLCPKQYVMSRDLLRHEMIHMNTGERPFVCDTCGKGFRARWHLTAHMRLHTGKRPYVCEVCNQAFTHPAVLRQHQSIHSGAKPFHCRHCSDSFRHSGTLYRHVRLVHNKKNN